MKGRISFEKWTIAAECSATVDCSWETFLANIAPHAASVVPAPAAGAPPPEVAVARLEGAAACGEAFGHSKIKGGSRMGSWSANRAECVWRRDAGTVSLWWTMRGGAGW